MKTWIIIFLFQFQFCFAQSPSDTDIKFEDLVIGLSDKSIKNQDKMIFIVQAHHFLQNLRQQLIVESNRDLLSKYKRLMELYMLARKTNSGKKPNVEKHPVLSNSDQMITVSESIDKLKSGSSQELVYGNSSLLKRENLEIIFKKVGL